VLAETQRWNLHKGDLALLFTAL